jgi:cell filamentation protein, protein adenylyltransferase
MDLAAFTETSPGSLVPVGGTDPRRGAWEHFAFVPHPLPDESPTLAGSTHRAVADARAALAALDSTARRLPNPRLFRRPALQAEAQSTSALEGTYAPLAEVLIADREKPPSLDMREILNYVVMADSAFHWVEEGHPLTVGMLSELQALLVRGTRSENSSSGAVRDHLIVVGQREGADRRDPPAHSARFVPPPPGNDLRAGLQDLVDWLSDERTGQEFDPVVTAALAHYQFETLHPFNDGNGRIGRLLIVLNLQQQGVLLEPTLTVSPWFESRRSDYHDRLLSVSTRGDWDTYVRFFARGLEASAQVTHDRMIALVNVQSAMKDVVRGSALRADTAHALVDFAVANIAFTVRQVERDLGVSYGRANALVNQLVQLDILESLEDSGAGGSRRFFAPAVYQVLVDG